MNNPEANANAFAGGWFRTGDQGYVDDQGYVFLTGRLKELINRGGEKISPREVDEVLLDHPAVAQAVTFGMPDARLGEEVAAAVIVRDPTVTEAQLRRFAAARLAYFKVPRRIVLLAEIPKGPTGKLQRIGLAAKLGLTDENRAPAEPVEFVRPRDAVEELVAGMWREILSLGEVSVLAHFLDLGGNSLQAMQLASRIRERLDIDLALIDLFDAPTIAAQAGLIRTYLLQSDATE